MRAAKQALLSFSIYINTKLWIFLGPVLPNVILGIYYFDAGASITNTDLGENWRLENCESSHTI